MTTRWWGIEISCPKCEKEAVLQMALFSADGELRFIHYCMTCKESVQYRVYATALAHRALLNDIDAGEKERKQRPRGPITPPLALPSLKPRLTEQDKKELRDEGIDPEDGELE